MTIAFAQPSAKAACGPDAIRVMVVDDAIVVRGLLARWIEAEAGLKLVATLRSGREAIEQIERTEPDVVILDIDMPDIDGITALPQLLEKRRDLVVIMASTLTRRNAEISLRALALGASDYIPKPETTREITNSAAFRRELIDKIRALGARRGRRTAPAWTVPPIIPAPGLAGRRERAADFELQHVASPQTVPAAQHAIIRLRPLPATVPRVLLIGSSTGGPQALNAVIGRLNGVLDGAPVLVVQHMPPTFTTILAEHLSRASGRVAREAVDGEPVRAGRIYVAPGGRHMRVVRRDGDAMIALDDGALVNFCKPAVDPLFASAAEVWGPRNLAVVLTGMGSDGCHGAGDIVAAGGGVIAQDEATSVVWGMPGATAHAGYCSAVLPLDRIAPKIVRMFGGGRP
jgi:two-component system, chemotaxis family, protein-glutamate methylesterase/glutaminase